MHNYWIILELTQKATKDEIKASYRRLSKVYHPDISSLPKSEAEAKFNELSKAYNYWNDNFNTLLNKPQARPNPNPYSYADPRGRQTNQNSNSYRNQGFGSIDEELIRRMMADLDAAIRKQRAEREEQKRKESDFHEKSLKNTLYRILKEEHAYNDSNYLKTFRINVPVDYVKNTGGYIHFLHPKPSVGELRLFVVQGTKFPYKVKITNASVPFNLEMMEENPWHTMDPR